jgi:beta-lactamase class A
MKKLSTVIAILFIVITTEGFTQLTQSQVETFFNRFTDRTERFEQLFSNSFLDKVPVTQLTRIRDDFERRYGKFVKAEIESGNNCKIYYERAVFPCIIAFEPNGQVSTLWFGAPSMQNDKIEQIKKELEAIEGVLSICIRKDGEELFTIKKDLPLAIGSTFKLYVLKALIEKINEGRLHWDDTLIVDDVHRSLPSGVLQNWPNGHTLTIATAANLMISISDNTATDLLIDKIGREYIEKFTPSTMRPLFKTREMFILKLGKDEKFVNWFLQADSKTKRVVLEYLDTFDIKTLDPTLFTSPRFIKLEWYATTEDLCRTIESLKDVPALSINSGFLKKEEWFYIAYKGGSEPGVLNYTYLVQKKDTAPLYSISATINNAEHNVDDNNEFTLLIKRIIDLVNKE